MAGSGLAPAVSFSGIRARWMAPESLVTVTSFGTPELAAEDMRKLREAGLNPYLGGEYYRYHEPVELRVPGSWNLTRSTRWKIKASHQPSRPSRVPSVELRILIGSLHMRSTRWLSP